MLRTLDSWSPLRVMTGKTRRAAPILFEIITSTTCEKARKKYPVVSSRSPPTTTVVVVERLGRTACSPARLSTRNPRPRKTNASVRRRSDPLSVCRTPLKAT